MAATKPRHRTRFRASISSWDHVMTAASSSLWTHLLHIWEMGDNRRRIASLDLQDIGCWEHSWNPSLHALLLLSAGRVSFACLLPRLHASTFPWLEAAARIFYGRRKSIVGTTTTITTTKQNKNSKNSTKTNDHLLSRREDSAESGRSFFFKIHAPKIC